jgi:hypothetical protein
MSHINQFRERAIYDAERGELEVKGATNNEPGGPPPPVAIHVAVKQLTPEGTFSAAGQAAVPESSLPDSEWETRIAADFVPGPATAFGLAIEFANDPGAFETFVWARTITIEAGTLPDDPTST